MIGASANPICASAEAIVRRRFRSANLSYSNLLISFSWADLDARSGTDLAEEVFE